MFSRSCLGRDRKVVRSDLHIFIQSVCTTTEMAKVRLQYKVYMIQLYVIKFVSDL
jgi:hypothetical protein